MKKIVFLMLLSLGLSSTVLGQSMSDAQLIQIAAQERKAGTPESEIAVKLLQKGATMDQIKRLRSQYADQLKKSGMGGTADNAINSAEQRMRVNNEVHDNGLDTHERADAPVYEQPAAATPQTTGRRVFGRDIFNNKSLTFEPQMNIATPQNYVLGPGD